jgi:DNA-binding transcriptional regulator/RsmH inhibitor MraZ
MKGSNLMYAIEFQATIRDGRIEVPEQFRDKLTDQVKVIILPDAREQPSIADSFIDQLLKSPLKVNSFEPLSRDDTHARH